MNVIKKGSVKVKRLVKKRKKIGAAPGTLLYTGHKKMDKIGIRVFNYNEDNIKEHELETVEDVFSINDSETVSWINIDGIHDAGVIEKLGSRFKIHPLVLEDILNPNQRPKVEEYENSIFIVLRMFYFDKDSSEILSEQMSIILGSGYIITLQEKAGDVFDGVRDRLRAGKGRIRKKGADYLAYALIDSIVDSYFEILESIGETIENLEEILISDPKQENSHMIHKLRREMIFLRKSIWPTREVVNVLQRRELPFVMEETTIFLRDVYDHTIQVIDTIESFRDVISGMLDIYLSGLSNRMNEVMKVLTIIATIFIPLTFVAGVYGMNFEHFPELYWDWIYPYGFWFFIIAVAGGMIIYFKRKKWL